MTIGALCSGTGHSLTHTLGGKCPARQKEWKKIDHIQEQRTAAKWRRRNERKRHSLAHKIQRDQHQHQQQPTNNQTQIRSFHFSIVGRNCKTQFLRCAYLAVLVFHLSFLVQINLYCCLAGQPLAHEQSEIARNCIRNRIEYNPHE